MSENKQPSSSRQGRQRGNSRAQKNPPSSQEQLVDQMQQLKVAGKQKEEKAAGSDVIKTKKAHVRKNQQGKWINNYLILGSLGKGQHGDVSLAVDCKYRDHPKVAIKVVKRRNTKTDRFYKFRQQHALPRTEHTPLSVSLSPTEEKIKREIAIMKKINHPHVVKLIEFIDDELDEKIYLIMEYLAGGEIRWRTRDSQPALRVNQVRRILRDVILGLDYLHSEGIIHRDIKPANLLWTEDRIMVKIADFGVSHYSLALHHANLKKKQAASNSEEDTDPLFRDDSELSRFAGTPMFLAPEIIHDATATPEETSRSSTTLNRSGSNLQVAGPSSQPAPLTPAHTSDSLSSRNKPLPKRPITKAIDVWALGITLYALLFGNIPWTKDNEFAIYQCIRNDDWEVPETMGCDKIPVGGRRQSPPANPEDVTEGYLVIDLLQKLLEKDADKRITLDGVRCHPWILRDMSEIEVGMWLNGRNEDGSPSLSSSGNDAESLPTVVTDEEQKRAITKSIFKHIDTAVKRFGATVLRTRSKISDNGGRLTRGPESIAGPSGSRGKSGGKHEKSSRGWGIGKGKGKDEENQVGIQSAPAGVLYNPGKTEFERKKMELREYQQDLERTESRNRKSQVKATRHQSMMDVGTSSGRSQATRSSKSHRSSGGGRDEEDLFMVSSMWNDGAPSRFASAPKDRHGSETHKQTGPPHMIMTTETGPRSVTSTPTKKKASLMLHDLQTQTQSPGTLQVPGLGMSMSPSTATTTTATTMTTATATTHPSRLLNRHSNSRMGSPQPPPTPSSAISMGHSGIDTSPLPTPSDERPKSRASLQSLLSWIPGLKRSSNYAPSTHSQTTLDPPTSAYPATSASTSPSSSSPPTSRWPPTQYTTDFPRDREARYIALAQRRSVDAFAGTGIASSRQSSGSEGFALAVRASSWGEFDDYARPSEDHTSLYSGGPIDDDAYFIGAGGVARSPVSSLPTSGALSRVSSGVSLGPSLPANQRFIQRGDWDRDGESSSSMIQDPTVLTRQSQCRSNQRGHSHSQSTSPLARRSFSRAESSTHSQSTERSPSHYVGVFESDDDDDDDESSDHHDRSSAHLDPQPSMSELYQQEDEESDTSSEENIRLEVKTRRASEVKHRRPSFTITEASPSSSPAPFDRRQPSPGHHMSRLSVAPESSGRRSTESERSQRAVACR
ncbi:hypothetical protein QCA50_014324 [Cerrena zonata]|uniref:Protein kinase domain-containing protein n=1 Tax=Cerrena zonata TaxID=2478898 RepID=A0AAW0FWE8_9APHY